jgi:hypothetical protein
VNDNGLRAGRAAGPSMRRHGASRDHQIQCGPASPDRPVTAPDGLCPSVRNGARPAEIRWVFDLSLSLRNKLHMPTFLWQRRSTTILGRSS